MEKLACTKCKLEKPTTEFSKDKYKKSGYTSHCNLCRKKNNQNWTLKNREKTRDYAKNSYQRNREAILQRRKNHRKDNPEKYSLDKKKRYCKIKNRIRGWKAAGIKDITIERYDQMIESQKNCCALCDTPASSLKKILNVDHNHSTGLVRELLCDSCNRGLGYFKDSADLLQKAVLYLKKHG
jgi:hypothetical protein